VSLSVSGTEPRAWERRALSPASVEPVPVLIVLLTVAVFVLRVSQMHQSLFGDEVWTYQDVFGRSLGSAIRNVLTGPENSPPLFFILAWMFAKLGDPSVWIRVPSLILGTATIPLVYLLGRETVGRLAALIGAAVVACGAFSVYYGIEARPYAMMAFFVTLSTLALIRAVRGRSRRWWGLYVLAATAAAYSHYTSIFVLGVQAGWSLWVCRDRLRTPILANTLIGVLYLPWLSHIRGKSLAVIGVLEPLNAHNVLTDLPRPIVGYPYASLQAIPGTVGLIAILCSLAVGAVALLQHRRTPAAHTRPGSGGRWLILALALATPVGLLLYSMIGTDLWTPRGLYASAPTGALIVGALLAAPRPGVRAAVTAVVLLTLLIGTIRAIGPNYARPPFRSIAAELDRIAPPGQAIVMYPSHFDQAVQAQFRKPHLVLSASTAAWRRALAGGTAYAILDDDSAQIYAIGTPHPAGFRLQGVRHYTGLVWLRVLRYRAQP
jgi:uncharacterized membrane protein